MTWNKHLSQVRIGIEHAFGMLKGRFPVLREVPGRDMERMITVIETCIILHNILLTHNDLPNDIDQYNGVDELNGDEEGEDNARELRVHALAGWTELMLRDTGIVRRNNLLEFFQNM